MRKASGYSHRGSNDFRPSRQQTVKSIYPHGHIANLSDPNVAHHKKVSKTGVLLSRAAILRECSDIAELPETHVVSRKSLSVSQHLGLFPQSIEVEPLISWQLDKETTDLLKHDQAPFPAYYRRGMVAVTDNRQVWKSDKTLLTPGISKESTVFPRVTSRSKRRITDYDEFGPVCIEVPITGLGSLE